MNNLDFLNKFEVGLSESYSPEILNCAKRISGYWIGTSYEWQDTTFDEGGPVNIFFKIRGDGDTEHIINSLYNDDSMKKSQYTMVMTVINYTH